MKTALMMVTFKVKASITLQMKEISTKEILKITISQAKAKCSSLIVLLILECLKMVCLTVKAFNITKTVTISMGNGVTIRSMDKEGII